MSKLAEAKSAEALRVTVLLSGGIDSVTALYDALERHTVTACLSFHYGSRHNDREIPFAAIHCRRFGIEHKIIDLAFIGKHFKSSLLASGGDLPIAPYDAENMRSTVVPFRNAIMLSVATGLAESTGSQAVVIGAHSGDHAIYPDCRPEFMQAMGAAMESGTYARIRLLRPFIAFSKGRIVRRGAELGVDFSETWSCYEGGELHCGKCGTCRERIAAFRSEGIDDPTQYANTGG